MKKGQWYPGTMARAVNALRQDLKIIDLVIELLDARIPASSRNPLFAGLLEGKKHQVLLHKADRADDALTERWHIYFSNQNLDSLPFSVEDRKYQKQLLQLLKREEQNFRSSRFKRPLRMIFVGIPNVGKSTLINYFARKAAARTANQPGITRGRQWIRIRPGLELLDTPGILWPNINEDSIKPLAAVGAIPHSHVDLEEVALWLLEVYLKKGREDLLLKRYSGLKCLGSEEMLEKIAFSQGCIKEAGKADCRRAAALILRDFQAGNLGRLTLEEPPSTRGAL